MNPTGTVRFVGLTLTMAAALAMSGCGGGSSKTASTPTTFDSFDSGLTDAAQRRHIRAAAAKAAGNTPSSGSVTQSSTGDGATTDSVSVSVVRGADGTMRYTVREAGGWSVDRDSARVLAEPGGEGWKGIEFHQAPGGGQGSGTGPGLYVDVYTDIEAPTTRPAATARPALAPAGLAPAALAPAGTGCGVGDTVSPGESCRYEGGGNRFTFTVDASGQGCALGFCTGENGNLSLNDFSASGTSGEFTIHSLPSGVMSVDAPSDSPSPPPAEQPGEPGEPGEPAASTVTVQDADYLAGGIWVRVPTDAASVADYEFGAFVDGNDPFEQANLAGLTGTATYAAEEGATAVYSHQATNRNYFVDGDVRLTADFGDASSLGSISGTISNITGEGPEAGWYEGVSVTLGTAEIGNADSGFFTGDTSTRGTDSTFTGKWGGQFYGNGAAGAPPGSVAGTFGGATDDGSESFVGVYGAYRQEQQ